MRHAASGGGLRRIGLGRRQMGGMHIHVGRSVIHTAESGGSRIVVVTDGIRGQTVFSGRGGSTGSREIPSRRGGRPVVVESGRGTGQTGARTGVVGGGGGSSSNRRVRVAGSIGSGQGRLGGSRQAQSR